MKVHSLVLAGAIVLGLAACDRDSSVKPLPPTQSSVVATTTSEPRTTLTTPPTTVAVSTTTTEPCDPTEDRCP